MAGFLDKFRTEVISSIWKDKVEETAVADINDKIALGVLLWVVAEADKKFLPAEESKMEEVLGSYTKLSKQEIAVVLASARKAAQERIDLYTFTHEVSEGLPYEAKQTIIENLFRVACVDKEMDDAELEVIRKISGLFHVAHKDFIAAKIKIKKEFGIDTAGL